MYGVTLPVWWLHFGCMDPLCYDKKQCVHLSKDSSSPNDWKCVRFCTSARDPLTNFILRLSKRSDSVGVLTEGK